jgi:hypothetical protein
LSESHGVTDSDALLNWQAGEGGDADADAGADVDGALEASVPDPQDLLAEHVRAVRQRSGVGLDAAGGAFAREQYSSLIAPLGHLVASMRSLLEGAEARERERAWLTGKLHGELDDSRLVDAVAGERAVFKRRGEPEQQHGHQQQLPKRISFALDASASMARMNGWDGRMDRQVEAVCALMETLGPLEHKWEYQLRVHSGSTADLELATFGAPPLSAEAKLDVVSRLAAHARGAQSGDRSLECLQRCIKDVAAEEADDAIVVLLSDANLGRYGIAPAQIASELASEPAVSAHAIFIGEPSAAEWIASELPVGKGFVVLDTTKLPLCVADILTEAAAR